MSTPGTWLSRSIAAHRRMPLTDRSSVALILAAALAIPALMVWVDRPVMLWVVEQPDSVRNFFGAITFQGKSLGYLIAGLLLIGIFSWRLKHAGGAKRARYLEWSRAGSALFYFAVIATSGMATNVIKPLIGRFRPNRFLQEGLYGFDAFELDAGFRSFPSGHATTVFALAFAVSWLVPVLRWPMMIFAATIGLSRVMVTAHFPSDIVGGALVAVGTALAFRYAFARRRWVFRYRNGSYVARPFWRWRRRRPQAPSTAP